MTTINLFPGAEGYDYSFDHPTPVLVAAQHRVFVIRYLTGGNGKALSFPERDALFHAGLSIIPTFETSSKAAAGGFAVGLQHGHQANAAKAALGVPGDIPVTFAVDWDVTGAGMPTVNEYLRGVESVLGTAGTGIYAGWRGIDLALPNLGCYWQTYAWSGGRVHPRAHILQYSNNHNEAQGNVDYNRILKPTPAWSGVPASAPAYPGVNLKRGSTGAYVRMVQQRLQNRGWSIKVDGDFGPATETIIRKFQGEKHLVVDGVVGPVTWNALWTYPVTP